MTEKRKRNNSIYIFLQRVAKFYNILIITGCRNDDYMVTTVLRLKIYGKRRLDTNILEYGINQIYIYC